MKKSQNRKPLRVIIILLFCFSFIGLQSQVTVQHTPAIFIGLGGGLNEMGIAGIAMELPVGGKNSFGASAGIGSWGYKLRGSLNFYTKEASYKSCFSLGVSYATGMDNFSSELPVEPDDEMVELEMDLLPVLSIDLVYSYNIRVGKSSKVVLSLGYSINTKSNAYTLHDSYYQLSDTGKQAMNLAQPGGLLLGLKFMFGVG
ncbi:hypothetical protein ACE01N_03535 [Saccharicrinis sp. FJH2]|uniref:hypothetical protein n=1 Tax=Saccharicrinis sp. FJH65 TaxID=3344659 RepID=UPI0035F35D90